jgi:hypothetical protein
VTVEFGPSRSRRFGRALAEARSGAGECSEVEPGRHQIARKIHPTAHAISPTAAAERVPRKNAAKIARRYPEPAQTQDSHGRSFSPSVAGLRLASSASR